MTNDQFQITNDGGRAQRAVKGTRCSESQLVISHWDLVIPRIIREHLRE